MQTQCIPKTYRTIFYRTVPYFSRMVAENSWNEEQQMNLHYQQILGSLLNSLSELGIASQERDIFDTLCFQKLVAFFG